MYMLPATRKGYHYIGLLRAWKPERPNRGPAARDLLHRDNDASAATTVFSRHSRSHDRTGSIWLFAWGLRSGCRPCLQLGKDTARPRSSRSARFCILPAEPGVQPVAAPWLSLFLTLLYSLLT